MKNQRINAKALAAFQRKGIANHEKIKNAWFADANGQEIIFPEVDTGDNYGVGDLVELENDKRPTFETIMPDGSTIIVKDGVLTDIVEDKELAPAAAKAFKCKNTSKSIKIFSDKPNEPYMVGNRVTVNGKEGMSLGRYTNGNLEISVNKGKITAIKNISKPAFRSLFKKNA